MATLKIFTMDEVDRKSRRDSFSSDDDMEQEVCQKLIRLSFAKIVSSKNTRGGAKLHRNLLILHLLQKARTNHRRSSSESPPPVSDVQEQPSVPTTVSEESETVEFEEISMDEVESATNTTSSPTDILSQAAEEITAEDDDDDQSLTFAPLQLVFATDAVTDRQLLGDDAPAVVVVPELHDMDVQNNGLSSADNNSTGGDENEYSSSSSSSSDEDCSAAEKEEIQRRKHRKRKPSLNQWTANKKCCTEVVNGQLNGLISVFSHGLTVKKSSMVADQLVPSVNAANSANNASLVSRSLSCPSLVRLACNPLICK